MKEKQLWSLFEEGKSLQHISVKTGLKESSVRTYISKIKKKLQLSEPRKIVVKKAPDTVPSVYKFCDSSIKKCKSWVEFASMMASVKVLQKSLEDRVDEFKEAYCAACIYPSRCDQCPTKVLMNKYLFN